jgi:hypothetical protein
MTVYEQNVKTVKVVPYANIIVYDLYVRNVEEKVYVYMVDKKAYVYHVEDRLYVNMEKGGVDVQNVN